MNHIDLLLVLSQRDYLQFILKHGLSPSPPSFPQIYPLQGEDITPFLTVANPLILPPSVTIGLVSPLSPLQLVFTSPTPLLVFDMLEREGKGWNRKGKCMSVSCTLLLSLHIFVTSIPLLFI